MFLSKPMLGTQIDWSNPLNDGVVLDLLMNEGHGDRINDLSGYGNHGVMHGFDFPPTVASGWNPGMDGVALQFDGSDDYVNCGNDASLDITDAITVEAWVKTNVTQHQGIVLKLNDSYWARYGLYEYTGNKVIGVIRTSAGSNEITSTSQLTDGNWHHVALTYDGAKMILYFDGINEAERNLTGHISVETSPLIIGLDYTNDVSYYFNGAIARVRILPRCMSAFEVMQTQINPYGVYLQ